MEIRFGWKASGAMRCLLDCSDFQVPIELEYMYKHKDQESIMQIMATVLVAFWKDVLVSSAKPSSVLMPNRLTLTAVN